MNNDDLQKIRGVIQEELKPVKKTLAQHTQILDKHTQILDKHTQILDQHAKILDKHAQKLESLWEQTVKLSVDSTEIQETQAVHTRILKRIETRLDKDNDNIIRLDKRVTVVEDQLGVIPPAEFSVIKSG